MVVRVVRFIRLLGVAQFALDRRVLPEVGRSEPSHRSAIRVQADDGKRKTVSFVMEFEVP
ncbi:hypothetical protein MPL3356_270099 [Mesorhizobium plurifarium]|uniref:Uncharacterized protein n=1 Tax=Mesorhizobium plurifarium TaxID=69974 RepID=A0A090G585_MESPL|nr:hypothetical protein MPL3356_270099 [Mesorhizobium plurifarium]CDX21036.1 hypothetical protein MPLB_1990055 [Mesorhizobium sp. ORS 3324]CDX44945.1 hypothetical protein MPLA_750024 [Mesorhizobium sp. ORS 3359]CDX52639.1 hypothetical protein MPL3365_170007 [Mesorhizobium plurifarium]